MVRFYLRITCFLGAFLCVVLAAVRTQPYDDREERALLLPADCAAPCILGIRPGATAVDVAINMLKQDTRVGQVTSHYDIYFDRPVVNWTWRNAPGSQKNGFMYLLDEPDPVVEALQVNPQIAMGYIYLIFGQPTCKTVAVYPFDQDQAFFVLVYREQLIVASAIFDARYHFDYRTPGHLEIISPATRDRIGYPDTLCPRQSGG